MPKVTYIEYNGREHPVEVPVGIRQLLGGFSGTIDAGLTTIDGTWTQAGNSLPLVLKRVKR